MIGRWRRLEQMPTHCIKPVTASQYKTFFYIDGSWNIYSFNTDSEHWNTINKSAPLTSMPASPLAMHIISLDQSDCFVILSSDDDLNLWLCQMLWTTEPGTMIPVHQDLLESGLKFKSSVLESNRLLIFLKVDKEAEGEGDEDDTENILEVHSYSLAQKRLSSWLTVRNIKEVHNIVAVPNLPKSFLL